MNFGALILASWRGMAGAMRANAKLFGITLLVLIVLAACFRAVTPPVVYAPSDADPRVLAPQFDGGLWALTLVSLVVTSVVSVPCMVAVHRFVLLGEIGAAFANRQRLAGFAMLLIMLRLAFQLPSFLAVAVGTYFGVLGVVVMILSVRWALSYPGAALDETAPVARSFRLTKGHWWYSLGVFICGFLPFVVVEGAVAYLVPALREITAPLGGMLLLVYAVLTGIYAIVFVSVGAALASQLYRKFGGMVSHGADLVT